MNGIAYLFSKNDHSSGGETNAISVMGNHVYTAGSQASVTRAANTNFWTDSISIKLTNGLKESYANAMFFG